MGASDVHEHLCRSVESRLLERTEVFAVRVHAYALMSNHSHVVVRIGPLDAAVWPPENVASRWVGLFPETAGGEVDPIACQTKDQNLRGNADRLETCRQTLSSLRWFMRNLIEPIARRADREDSCTGSLLGQFFRPAKPAFLTSM